MSDQTQPTFLDSATNEWLARDKAYSQLCQSVIPINKRTLLDELARHGITAVTVQFDGCGDSGQIEDIHVTGTENCPVGFPSGPIQIALASWDHLKVEHKEMTPKEAIEYLVYELLEQTHRGWEDNDGAYGTITFVVEKQSIVLEINERRTESDYYQHEF